MAKAKKGDETPKISGSAATAANKDRRMAKQKKAIEAKKANPPAVPKGSARHDKRHGGSNAVIQA